MDATKSTKHRILVTSARLFSELGYDTVSMRDIAAKVGIKAASIYNHFPSKQAILKNIYSFYVEQRQLASPRLEQLLERVETEHPFKVLAALDLRYPSGISDLMDIIMSIANKRIGGDTESERFIWENLIDSSKELLVPLLHRMIQLGKIEPMDVDGFSCLFSYYAFSGAVLNRTRIKMSEDQWKSGLAILFSLIKIVPPDGKKPTSPS